jgi:aminoglycoside phosphotransferase (APT) family kinase protein
MPFQRYIINNLKKLIMKWSRHIYGHTGSPRVYRLTKTVAVKFCSKSRSHEAETMQFVSRHTSIPIPRVLHVWTNEDGCATMMMEWVEGQRLHTVWPRLTSVDKLHVANQIKQHLDEIRSLHQTTNVVGWIGTYDRQPLSDALLSNRPCGPFTSDQEFNQFLISRLAFMESTEEGRAELEGLKNDVLATPYRQIVFTHSDIAARNILVNNHNDIVAILDWEMAGWMPEQWEYLKAMWMGQYDEGWPEFVHLFLEPYDHDLQIHNEMCRLHGSPF